MIELILHMNNYSIIGAITAYQTYPKYTTVRIEMVKLFNIYLFYFSVSSLTRGPSDYSLSLSSSPLILPIGQWQDQEPNPFQHPIKLHHHPISPLNSPPITPLVSLAPPPISVSTSPLISPNDSHQVAILTQLLLIVEPPLPKLPSIFPTSSPQDLGCGGVVFVFFCVCVCVCVFFFCCVGVDIGCGQGWSYSWT